MITENIFILTLSQTGPGFYVLAVQVLKTLGKGEIARNEQFLLFSSTSHSPASLCHSPLSSCVRPCIRPSVR